MKYSKRERYSFIILGVFLFWFFFQLWGMPSALAGLLSSLLLPRFLYKGKHLLFMVVYLLIALFFGTLLLYSNVNVPIFRLLPNKDIPYFTLRIISSYLIAIVVTGLGSAFRFLIERLYREREMKKLENEKLEAELSLLKAQVNPHFLFNTLNTIYYQIDKLNATARETLTKFSELLRYQLYHTEREKIDISRETEFIKSYIELQKLRMNKNYCIDYKEEGNVSGFRIAPLLLIPVVENCFNHWSHFIDKPNRIQILVQNLDNWFLFTALNTYETNRVKKNISGHTDGGIGLSNVKKRLQLLYPDRHKFIISEDKDVFKVQLSIRIE